MPAPFEWDEEKDRSNTALNVGSLCIGFEEATGIFTSPILTAPDTRQDYGEERGWSSSWYTPAAAGASG